MTKKTDDLTKLKGIGPATAKALAKAGVETFAALAALTDPLPHALQKLGSQVEWNDWREEAAVLAHPASSGAGAGTLLGSSVQPSEIVLAEGHVVALGVVVANAHAKSGLSVEAWNALPDEEREAHIAATIEADRKALAEKTDTAASDGSNAEAQRKDDGGSRQPPPPAPERMRAVLVVRARGEQHWRAGRKFVRTPVELNAADLTEDEIKLIEGDPLLIAKREERPELPHDGGEQE